MFSFDSKAKEILIYDVIGEGWDGSGVSASAVADALKTMGGKRVTVRINSPGGVADEGIAIYNTLKRYAGGVDTVIDSLAASAASIIALAGDSRVSLTGSRWMIHRAMGLGIGNSADMRKLADLLDIYDGSLADIYAGYMEGMKKDAILSQMGEETWFTAEKAVEIGLSTGQIEGETAQKPTNAAWFEHPPADIDAATTLAQLRPTAVKREIARLKLRLQGAK